MRVWVNFRELRAKLKFEDVLRHYGVEVKRKGSQHQGICPLPGHGSNVGSPSFSANLDRGIFQCFGCGAKGNVLEFAALMQGVDLKDGDALRKVAIELQQRFFSQEGTTRKSAAALAAVSATKPPQVLVNAPLDFQLKDLDAGHPYLSARGFTRQTMQFFEVGFCSRGFLKGRIAIPLHGTDGKLAGYAGRVIEDGAVNAEDPKYRFPSRKERDGKVYEFDRTLFLYNAFRFKLPVQRLVVVAGFPAVWWLTQCGLVHVVATMGTECSEEQAEQAVHLVPENGQIWVLADDSEAGRMFAQSLLLRLSPCRLMRWVKLEQGRRPTDLSKEELKARFTM